MNRRAFTLIEILTTLAVISVLVGLLAPALGSARESARAALCASNARQLQLAAAFYATDHRDAYPPGARDFTRNLHRWHGARVTTADPFNPADAPITSYLDTDHASRAIRECPTFAHTVEDLHDHNAGFETAAGGYGYNNAFVGTERSRDGDLWRVTDDTTGSRSDRFRRPAATIAFTDSAFLADRLIEYSFAEPRVWPDYPGYAPDPSIHFRHTDSANIAWLDGHVSHERMAQTEAGWYSEEHAGAFALGWPGDFADNRLFDYD